MRIFYFGCHRQAGHYYWKPGMIKADKEAAGAGPHSTGEEIGCVPWRWGIDGGLQPMIATKKGPTWYAPQGQAVRHIKEGWTAIAFWDYSIDTRLGSSSTFCLEGKHTFDAALEICKENFPQVFERFDFEIRNILR